MMKILPGTNGLRFLRKLQESSQRVLLFFITTDGSINVKLQAPRLQLQSMGMDTGIVDIFGERIKAVLNGFKAPVNEVDIRVFTNAIQDFIDHLDKR